MIESKKMNGRRFFFYSKRDQRANEWQRMIFAYPLRTYVVSFGYNQIGPKMLSMHV